RCCARRRLWVNNKDLPGSSTIGGDKDASHGGQDVSSRLGMIGANYLAIAGPHARNLITENIPTRDPDISTVPRNVGNALIANADTTEIERLGRTWLPKL